jgi:hypothetical protein
MFIHHVLFPGTLPEWGIRHFKSLAVVGPNENY